nr:cell wall protein DAN4-like isoform X2 [Aedes albopictus]
MEKDQNATDEDDNSNLVIITEEHYDYEMEDDDRRSSVIDQSPQDDDDDSPQKFIVGGSSSESDEDRLGKDLAPDQPVGSNCPTPSITVTQPGATSATGVASYSSRTGGSSSGSDVALHETGGELSDDDETENYLVQNTDQVTCVEPSEPPAAEDGRLPSAADCRTETESNTIVDETEDGTVRTTVITTTTTTINATSDDLPEDLQRQLLEQMQLAAANSSDSNNGSNTVVTTVTTTSSEDADEPGSPNHSTTTTTTKTTTNTITLTSTDVDFPEDELLQKITTTTQLLQQSNTPEVVKETRTVTVTEVVDGKPDAKPSINTIVDEFMNEERRN